MSSHAASRYGQGEENRPDPDRGLKSRFDRDREDDRGRTHGGITGLRQRAQSVKSPNPQVDPDRSKMASASASRHARAASSFASSSTPGAASRTARGRTPHESSLLPAQPEAVRGRLQGLGEQQLMGNGSGQLQAAHASAMSSRPAPPPQIPLPNPPSTGSPTTTGGSAPPQLHPLLRLDRMDLGLEWSHRGTAPVAGAAPAGRQKLESVDELESHGRAPDTTLDTRKTHALSQPRRHDGTVKNRSQPANSPLSSSSRSTDSLLSTGTALGPAPTPTIIASSPSTSSGLLAARRGNAPSQSSKLPPAPLRILDTARHKHSHHRSPSDVFKLPKSPLSGISLTSLSHSRRSSYSGPLSPASPSSRSHSPTSLPPSPPPSRRSGPATASGSLVSSFSAATKAGAGSVFRHKAHESESHPSRSNSASSRSSAPNGGKDVTSPSPIRGLIGGFHSYHKSYPLPTSTPPPNDSGSGTRQTRAKSHPHHSKQLPPIPLQIHKTQNAATTPDLSNSFAPAGQLSSRTNRHSNTSSTSGTTLVSRLMASSENLGSSGGGSGSTAASTASSSTRATFVAPKPFVVRNGRTYIGDPTVQYMLPVDLQELDRQTLRTLLCFHLFNGPVITDAFRSKPPLRVLEVGCGSGFWSMMCHRFYARQGHKNISFTGIDVVPLCGTGLDPNSKPDKDMVWRFIQHDMRRTPWPALNEGEFDLIMVKDMALAAAASVSGVFFEEYLRLLKPGGVIEIWEQDLTVRMLRPHAGLASKAAAQAEPEQKSSGDAKDDPMAIAKLGAYVITANTPLSAPLNPYLVEYNGWLNKALDARAISPVPCTIVGPAVLQETSLTDVRSRRLAVPFSELRWEREGVGGVITKDGKSYIDSMKSKSAKGKAADAAKSGKTLTKDQAALRNIALETTVGLITALEPLLREVNGKSQDEWDHWVTKMTQELMSEDGTTWGECLEIGAWTARKRK